MDLWRVSGWIARFIALYLDCKVQHDHTMLDASRSVIFLNAYRREGGLEAVACRGGGGQGRSWPPGASLANPPDHYRLLVGDHWACCTTLATAVAAKIAVATVAERRQVGRDSLHCTTR